MGKSPDQIELAIRRQRDYISQRISSVQGRVHDDIDSLKSEVSQTAGEKAGAVKESLHLGPIGEQVERHPLSVLAGAFGAGVMLGMVGDPGDGKHTAPPETPPPSANRNDSSFIGGLADSIMGTAGETLQEGLRQLLRDGMSSVIERRKEPSARPSGY
jgi:hypothetical protein